MLCLKARESGRVVKPLWIFRWNCAREQNLKKNALLECLRKGPGRKTAEFKEPRYTHRSKGAGNPSPVTKFKRKDPELAVVGGAKRNKKRKCPFVKPKEEAEQEVPPLCWAKRTVQRTFVKRMQRGRVRKYIIVEKYAFALFTDQPPASIGCLTPRQAAAPLPKITPRQETHPATIDPQKITESLCPNLYLVQKCEVPRLLRHQGNAPYSTKMYQRLWTSYPLRLKTIYPS